MEFEDHVRFLPWVGEHYLDGRADKRILILGESHYDSWPNEDGVLTKNVLGRDFTRYCVQGIITPDENYTSKFWTNIAKTFIGHHPEKIEKRHFWHSVAFYNYVQDPISGGARVRPSKAQWALSADPFTHVMEIVKPDMVFVFGFGLWWHVMHGLFQGGDDHARLYASVGKNDIYVLDHTYNFGSSLFVRMRHPSSAYSADQYHPHVHDIVRM